MFWEPGAFAGYIIVALSLFINDLSVLWKDYKKQTIVLVIALISTFSTTGIICFAFLVVYFLFTKTKSKFYAVLITGILLIPLSYYAFTRLSFLGGKINEQFVSASETEVGEVNIGRIGTLMFDWYYIKKHPLVGNGLDATTRYSDHILISDKLDGLGNGFSGIIGDLGIVFVLVYFCVLYKNKSLLYNSLFIIEVILLLQGECFLRYPLFMTLPFINFMLFRKRNENSRSYYLPQ